MVQKNKGYYANKNSNRAEARQRGAQKTKSEGRKAMRDKKFAGDEREFFDDDRSAKTQKDSSQTKEISLPVEELESSFERKVRVGTPKRGQLSTPLADGSVIVAYPFLRKPSNEDWARYRVRISEALEDSRNKVYRARAERARTKSDIVLELRDILTEFLRLTVGPEVVLGSRSQGQRLREIKRTMKALPRLSVRIVVDNGPNLTVLFPYRYVSLPWDANAILNTWPSVFAAERADAIARYDSNIEYPTVGVDNFQFQGLPSVDLGFAEIVGAENAALASDLLKEYWHLVPIACAELYAASLVPSEGRIKYLIARLSSEMLRHVGDVVGLKQMLVDLASHPAVLALVGALNLGNVPAFWASSQEAERAYDGQPQGFLGDFLKVVPREMSPGTVLHSVLLLLGAGFAFSQCKASDFSIPHVSSTLFRYVAKVTVPTSPADVVVVVLKQVPILWEAVSSAITTRSLSALAGRGDNLFVRCVDVQTGASFHNRGQYPNTLFDNSSSFLRELDAVYHELRELSKMGDATAVKFFSKLQLLHTDCFNDQLGKWRESPYCVAIVGESCIGKSDVMAKLTAFLSKKKFGRSTPPDRIYVFAAKEKYVQGYRMYHEVVWMDDIGNARAAPGVSMSNPTDPIIGFANNVNTCVPMADVESKGKYFWNSPFLFASSNLRDLGAGVYSNEPVSILRRFDVIIEPTVRPEYRIPNSFMLDPARVPPASEVFMPDLWTFKVWVMRKSAVDAVTPLVKIEIPLPGDGSIYDLISVLEVRVEAHFQRQRALQMSNVERPYVDLSLDALREQSRVAQMLQVQSFSGYASSWVSRYVARLVIPNIVKSGISWALSAYTPELVLVGCAVVTYCWNYWLQLIVLVACIVCRFRGLFRSGREVSVRYKAAYGAVAALVTWYLVRSATRVTVVKPQGAVEFELSGSLPETLALPQDTVSPTQSTRTYGQLVESTRRKGVFALFSAGSAANMGVLFPVATGLYIANYHIVAPVMLAGLPFITVVLFRHSDTRPQCFRITLAHIFRPEPNFDVVFLNIAGPKEVDRIADFIPSDWMVRLGDKRTRFPVDEASLQITRVPDDVKRGNGDPGGRMTAMGMRMSAPVDKAFINFPLSSGEVVKFVMITMKPWGRTLQGDCGAHLILNTRVGTNRVAIIAGLLSGVASVDGATVNVFAPVSREMCMTAKAHFAGVVPQSFGARLFGQPSDMFLDVSAHHPELPHAVNGYVNSLGVLKKLDGPSRGHNVASMNTFRSNLTRGLFHVSEELDVILGPLKHRFPVQTTHIDHFANPLRAMDLKKEDYDMATLELAASDLLCGFREMFQDVRIKPATLFEAVNCGEFLPSFQLSTASGFGRKGAKVHYVERACDPLCARPGCTLYHPTPEDYIIPGRINFYPKSELLAEIKELEDRLAAGEDNLAIFRAALKDEPIGCDKTKIRAFYVGTIAINLLVRRFIMPFLSRMQGRPTYECKLGINVLSPEWEVLCDSLESCDKDKRLGGDYSGFDLSVHGALLAGFYACIRQLALDDQWSERDVAILDGLISNLSNPVYVFLGQAFSVSGSNPSGVASTTHANSGVNALIHRYAFYKANPNAVISEVGKKGTAFTRSVQLATYGDDVIGAVREVQGVVPITNWDVRDAALCFGMRYGPADKSGADLPEYYDQASISFLKCDSVHIPEMGHRVGAIALASIRKSLAFEHNDAFEARVSTMQSALRLYFPHAAREGGDVARAKFSTFRSVLTRKLADISGEANVERAEDLLPTYDVILNGAPSECAEATGEVVIDMW